MSANVLVIDDDPFDQALIRTAFQQVGSDASVKTVPDVSVAMGMIEELGSVDLILVDLKLGLESGCELVEWIRRQPELRDTPTIVMSGSDSPADIRSAYAAGATAYVVKRPDLDGIKAVVSSIDAFWLQTVALPGRSSSVGGPDLA